MDAGRGPSPQSYASGVASPVLRDGRNGILSRRGCPAGGLQECRPSCVRDHPAGGPIQEADSQATFQLPELLADCRLGQAQEAGGGRDASGFNHGEEGTKLTEGGLRHNGILFLCGASERFRFICPRRRALCLACYQGPD